MDSSQSTPNAPLPARPQSALIEWANGQDNWIRSVVSELISTRQSLPDERVQHFYELLLVEKELSPGTLLIVQPLSGSLDGAGVRDILLISLENVRDVNALTASQKITFNPKMTILFGENA
jgi:hypothetical protein